MTGLTSAEFRASHTIVYEAPIKRQAISQPASDPNLLPFVAGDVIDMDRNGLATTTYGQQPWYQQGKLEGHRGVSTYGTAQEPVFTNGFDELSGIAQDLGRAVLQEGDCDVALHFPRAYYGGNVTTPTSPQRVTAENSMSLSTFRDRLLSKMPGIKLEWAVDTHTGSFLLVQPD